MQYFRPSGDNLFVGDCMPFYHEGVFHLFYLLDEGHHSALGGLGAHQWAHASTTDLIHWEHHPLAVPITHGHEGSMCTGSVFYHDGVFRAYYATRMVADRSEHLSMAASDDGIHFEKTEPNPFASPGPEYTKSFRDPNVFQDPDTGLFHMLVTSALKDYPVQGRGGCLAHLISTDLQSWETAEPFIIPGYLGDPECPDTFHWNGWYYLVFSNHGLGRYRMARSPLGPWIRPAVDTFDTVLARVPKTAAFGDDRRLAVAFIPTREGDKDDGAPQYGGHALFREIIQHPDGTLGPPEMIPATGEPLDLPASVLTGDATVTPHAVSLRVSSGFAAVAYDDVPRDARITAKIIPRPDSSYFGLCLRGSGAYESGYELRISPKDRRVELRSPGASELAVGWERQIGCVDGLDRPFGIDIVMQGGIIDVCIDGRVG